MASLLRVLVILPVGPVRRLQVCRRQLAPPAPMRRSATGASEPQDQRGESGQRNGEQSAAQDLELGPPAGMVCVAGHARTLASVRRSAHRGPCYGTKGRNHRYHSLAMPALTSLSDLSADTRGVLPDWLLYEAIEAG
jgi:hypothetical protein